MLGLPVRRRKYNEQCAKQLQTNTSTLDCDTLKSKNILPGVDVTPGCLFFGESLCCSQLAIACGESNLWPNRDATAEGCFLAFLAFITAMASEDQ